MRTSDLSASAKNGRDPGLWLWGIAQRCWVRCPNCAQAALVERLDRGWRLTCLHCGRGDSCGGAGKPTHFGGASSYGQMNCVACGRNFQNAPWKGKLLSHTVEKVMVCRGCGRRAQYHLYPLRPDIKDGVDPAFGLPLYLTTAVGAQTLWALNPQHLQLLDSYLGADLRKRPLHINGMTMMARLPRWMKLAANRPKVLAGLRRLSVMAKDLA